MDINSLLSPEQNFDSTPSTPAQSPRRHVHRVRSTSLKQTAVSSPLVHSNLLASSLPQHVIAPLKNGSGLSPLMGPSAGVLSTTPPPSDPQSLRHSSTPSMDTLADLASMQNHQPSKPSAPLLRSTGSYETQLSPSTIYPTVQPVPPTSNPRSSFDISMFEGPKHAVRTEFSNTSLTLEMQKNANLLTLHLQGNPHAYQSHVDIINLLHQGFIEHVYPSSSPDAQGDPHTYDLLDDLRTARENMDKLFAIGEDLWADWIQDESMLARRIDEFAEVWQNCVRAVDEEYGSTKLWVVYGDWMLHCCNSVREGPAQNESGMRSEEELLIGREEFTWSKVLETWEMGAEQTMWRVNDSHLVWDRYLELAVEDLKIMTEPQEKASKVQRLFEKFERRLQTPHKTWKATFDNFSSSFVTQFLNDQYEEIMVSTNRNAVDARNESETRMTMEDALQNAQESNDRTAEYAAFAEYLEWERTPAKRKRVNFDLTNAVYERAVLRFPSDSKLWEDWAIFIVQERQTRPDLDALPILCRATRHCPWSGSLWSQYLLSAESQGESFKEIEKIKHKATSTGLLDGGGMQEVLKVHTAWCSYLRRRAFRPKSTDEDLDVAEMGIRSSIENMQELANQKTGEGSNPDPLFRLERVYIKFLSESGSWDSAREAFRGLVSKQGDSWEFWMRYYVWEMMCWAKFIQGEKPAEDGFPKKTPSPHYATAILREAIKRETVDWPEKLMQAYIAHCEDHEDVDELQLAIIEVKKMEKVVAERRAREAVAVAETAAADVAEIAPLNEVQQEGAEVVANGLHTGKRKRAEDEDVSAEHKKKNKSEIKEGHPLDHPVTAENENRRDRENATILVQNLPEEITETRVRQFFRDCGTINSLKIVRQVGTSAAVEFEDQEAAQFAQSRDGRDLDGHAIEVQMGSGSTLYVTNFPPTGDEHSIRKHFEPYGEIMDIRFPSLKYNTHRRFCYVQFKLNAAAKKALEELDGLTVGENQKLLVKLSNPSIKQDRSGPMEEGREVYVQNVNWAASEDDVANLFSEHGQVESVRIPRNLIGKSRGIAFVVFTTADEADAALVKNGKMFRSREILVEKSRKSGAKRHATTIVTRVERSNSNSTERNDAADSPSAMSITSTDNAVHTSGDRQARTLALMNIPDTVNDSRIQAMAEPYGSLVKVALRPDHQGAIVEYVDAADAGRAALGLEGKEIVSGRKIKIGTVPEMLKQNAETKVNKIQIGKAQGSTQNAVGLQPAAPIKRPGQVGGKRGGLGQKKGLGFSATNRQSGDASDGGAAGRKSNDDFRALLARES